MQPSLNTNIMSDDQPEFFADLGRKSNTISTSRSQSQPDIEMGCVGATEEERQNPASPSSLANQRWVHLLLVRAYRDLRALKSSYHVVCETRQQGSGH